PIPVGGPYRRSATPPSPGEVVTLAMSAVAEPLAYPPETVPLINLDAATDRRADIEGKQARVVALLGEVECAGLLGLSPENFSWLTGGAAARGVLSPNDQPGLYFAPEGRWALCCNVESQRLFDEELDGLGFQLKEWPWQWGRDQLLADLCEGRKVACDTAVEKCLVVNEQLT